MAIIEIKDLDFAYNGEAVLKDVNLTIWQKDFVAIIGPNGGGKTTLLKLVLGLLTPAKGTVRVDGKSPQEASPCIGYVPQGRRLFGALTVAENILLGHEPAGLLPWTLNRRSLRRRPQSNIRRPPKAFPCAF